MAYKILFLFIYEVIELKEIGELLREEREIKGVTTEEAAADLNVQPSQIENIEIGNREVFKDLFELKKIIRDYSKYLGLDPEKIEDEFNEFVFEYTSKIPIEEIEKANLEKKKEQDAKKAIKSPYTKIEEKKRNVIPIIIIVLLLLIAFGVFYFLFYGDSEVAWNNKDEVKYELTK